MVNTQRTYKAALDRLNTYMREHGLRPSQARKIVLERIWQLPQPFTAAQLEEACSEDRISTGTVYNSLNLFVMAQILHAIQRQRGKNVTEYELISLNQVRMEVICRKCGRISEIHDKAITRMIQERTYSNFVPQQYSLFVYGECKLCRRLRQKEE